MTFEIFSAGYMVEWNHIETLRDAIVEQATSEMRVEHVLYYNQSGMGFTTEWQKFDDMVYRGTSILEDRKTMAENMYRWIHKRWKHRKLRPEIVCVFIDLDDMILPGALKSLAQIFADPNCWIAYGGYKCKSGAPAMFNARYYKGEDFRTTRWRGTHLKAIRAGLLQRLTKEDLQDASGNWLPMCSDLALMLPCLEMAGHDRIRWNKKVVYEYNDMSDLNDHKVDLKFQKELEGYIRSKPPRERLETL